KVARAWGLTRVYEPQVYRFGRCRPHCKRKPRVNRLHVSTAFGTKSIGWTFLPKPTANAARIVVLREWTGSVSSRLKLKAEASGWKDCSRNCGRRITGPAPC